MRKVLPMSSPIIRCYANHAHAFSILGAYSEQHIPWVYNYYVQLYIPYDLKEFKADYLIPGLYYHTPNLLVSRIDRKTSMGIKGSVLDAIKHYIDNEYYIYTLVDVEKMAAYNNTNFKKHDPLIYGYDDEKREIYFADTYIHGKYGIGVASYDEIVCAVGTEIQWSEWGTPEHLLDVLCMKYRDSQGTFAFNKDMYTNLLIDYMEQRDSFSTRWKVPGVVKNNVHRCTYGIGIYSYLKDYVNSRSEKSMELDRRGFFVIWEHKIILEEALTYLLGCHWKKMFLDEAFMLENDTVAAQNMLNLCLKYNITKEKKLIDKIKKYAAEMEKREEELIPRLIRIIKDK